MLIHYACVIMETSLCMCAVYSESFSWMLHCLNAFCAPWSEIIQSWPIWNDLSEVIFCYVLIMTRTWVSILCQSIPYTWFLLLISLILFPPTCDAWAFNSISSFSGASFAYENVLGCSFADPCWAKGCPTWDHCRPPQSGRFQRKSWCPWST